MDSFFDCDGGEKREVGRPQKKTGTEGNGEAEKGAAKRGSPERRRGTIKR